MFPDLRQLRERIAAALGEMSGTRQFRVGVAVLFTAFHLVMFAAAGRDRLDLPFNSAPGQAPYYSNPKVSSLRGYPRQPHHWSRLIVSRWDSEHYIGFAVRGVSACPTEGTPGPVTDLAYLECGLGWLPAYGMVGGTIAHATGIPDDVMLVVISVLCTILVNLLWTQLLARSTRPARRKLEAFGALIAFNVFPTAFYLVDPVHRGVHVRARARRLRRDDERALDHRRAAPWSAPSTALRASARSRSRPGLGCAAPWSRRGVDATRR